MQQFRLPDVARSIIVYAVAGFDGIAMVTKAEASEALLRKHKIVSSSHAMGCYGASCVGQVCHAHEDAYGKSWRKTRVFIGATSLM
jgi:hypothetical protein